MQTPSLFRVSSWGLFRHFRRFSGDFRQFAWALFRWFQAICLRPFQVISGNFRQFQVISGNFEGGRPRPKKKTVLINKKKLGIAHLMSLSFWAEHPPSPYFCGILKVEIEHFKRDSSSQARLKISSVFLTLVRGIPGNSFWGPDFGVLGEIFLGEMKITKVDMLGRCELWDWTKPVSWLGCCVGRAMKKETFGKRFNYSLVRIGV